VQRVGLALQGIAPIVYGGSALRGIAVDEIAGLLYWTTSNLTTGAAIQSSTIDGTALTTLVRLPPGANPRGIAVDHAGGKLYWADFDHDAIYRANLDGSLMTAWQVLPPGSGPYGVAFDSGHQAVLWTEYNSGAIRGAAAAGGPGYGTLTLGLQQPTYLTVDALGTYVYWAQGAVGAQHLARMSTSGGAITVLPVPLASYGGVAFSRGGVVSAPADPPAAFAVELWPIPAAGPVHVSLALPTTSRVRIAVLDLQGREVARLPEETLAPGRYQREWRGAGPHGRVPAGLYFVRIDAGTQRWTRRVVLAR
jgi:low-density lipoprotein receptor class B